MAAVCSAASLLAPSNSAQAQDAARPAPRPVSPPVIDTIILERAGVFPDSVAEESWVFRAMNALHVITKPRVIRAELLFGPGQPYDSAVVAESERNLRDLQLFRSIGIDTTTLEDGKFAVIVKTVDGWSTKPKVSFAVAADGTVTVTLGVLEINLLGTGSLVQVYYVKDVDRDGLKLATQLNRMFGSRFSVGGSYQPLSDGTLGDWQLGFPFYSSVDRSGNEYMGFGADRRVIQFTASGQNSLDSIFWTQQAFRNDLTVAFASRATVFEYLRFGAVGQVKQEKYFLEADSLQSIPDSVSGYLGGLVEFRHSRFRRLRMFNGFGTEDVDLSTALSIGINVAPEAFGYARAGFGPNLIAATAVRLGRRAFVHSQIEATSLFSSAGLDSGRVVIQATLGHKPAPRQATVLHLEAGASEAPPPGGQFDLGFTTPPRLFAPHSFVGTRELWGMLEHRYFAFENVVNLVSIGFAGFFDFGGAWYHDLQPSRYGGNVGVGLRLGAALGTIPNMGRLDVGYLFGDGFSGSPWAISFGAGFAFPQRVKLRTDRDPAVTATGI